MNTDRVQDMLIEPFRSFLNYYIPKEIISCQTRDIMEREFAKLLINTIFKRDYGNED